MQQQSLCSKWRKSDPHIQTDNAVAFSFFPVSTRGQRAEPETYVALPAPRSGAGHSDKINDLPACNFPHIGNCLFALLPRFFEYQYFANVSGMVHGSFPSIPLTWAMY